MQILTPAVARICQPPIRLRNSQLVVIRKRYSDRSSKPTTSLRQTEKPK